MDADQFKLLEKDQFISTAGTQIGINKTIPAQDIALRLQMPYDNIIINATVPETPTSVALCKGTVSDDDYNRYFKYVSPNLTKDKRSLPSETEALALAVKALEPYGGLPSDAVLHLLNTSVAYEETSPGKITKQYLIMVSVGYGREINGMPVAGDRDAIGVDIGENGEVLSVGKLWRSIEITGKAVPVIPAQAAINKLQNGEAIHKLQSSNDLFIDSIRLGYYEREKEIRESIVEPVWIFKSTTIPGVELLVYARQFANFTATPTYGKAPLDVTFTDTSDASPVKWLWDFGDGTTSSEQNPAHLYTTAGSYDVTLRAWNDLGSDTMVKTRYILIGKKAIVMQTKTKLDDLIVILNAMDIQQGIKNSLTQKFENAKNKNVDALKFIDQNKEYQANNMLNAGDNLIQAFMNEVDAQTGNGISTGDAAKLNKEATEIRELIQEAIGTPI